MKLRLLFALVLCLVAACGSSDPKALIDEGFNALNSGKYEEAAKSYEKALAALASDTANPEWKRAKMGVIQAHVHIDAARAKNEFLELAGNPGKVTDSDFNLIASKLGDAHKFDEAIALLEVGKKTFPNSTHLDLLGKDLVARAQASGNTSAVDKLKSLGYVGGD